MELGAGSFLEVSARQGAFKIGGHELSGHQIQAISWEQEPRSAWHVLATYPKGSACADVKCLPRCKPWLAPPDSLTGHLDVVLQLTAPLYPTSLQDAVAEAATHGRSALPVANFIV